MFLLHKKFCQCGTLHFFCVFLVISSVFVKRLPHPLLEFFTQQIGLTFHFNILPLHILSVGTDHTDVGITATPLPHTIKCKHVSFALSCHI